MTRKFEIVPVFPSVITIVQVSEDISALWANVENLDFKSNSEESYLSNSSKNMNILDSLPDIKKVLLDYFYEFKNDTLKLQNTNFKITTSWITKTETGGFCQYHNHKNSYYSGVLYKSDSNSGGNLLFSDDGIREQTIFINAPTEFNILNSNQTVIFPQKNRLVLFPSNLKHRITTYLGKDIRYSLAFNLFPTGKIGYNDSSIDFNNLNR